MVGSVVKSWLVVVVDDDDVGNIKTVLLNVILTYCYWLYTTTLLTSKTNDVYSPTYLFIDDTFANKLIGVIFGRLNIPIDER